MTSQQLSILNALVTFAAENVPGGLSADEREVAQIVGRWALEGPSPVRSSGKIQSLPVREFREFGYLQELNRRFLHPLGLALEVIVNQDGTEVLGGVWDGRDDPEGFVYGPDTMEAEKIQRVSEELRKRKHIRFQKLGYVIQPED
jgi:hypothetical protein